MAANIRAIINQSHQLCGVIAADEVADGNDTNIALIKLNEIIAQLNVDQLFPYSRTIVEYNVIAEKWKHTMGIDTVAPIVVADIAYDRPSYVNRINYYSSVTSNPIEVLQLDLPDLLSKRTQGVGAPRYFAVNPAYPLAEVFFDMKPQAGSIIEIVYNKVLPTVTINDMLQIPPEYNEVLVTALARKVAVLKQMPTDIVQQMDTLYKESINQVMRSNSRNQVPVLDDLLGNPRSNRNIYNLG